MGNITKLHFVQLLEIHFLKLLVEDPGIICDWIFDCHLGFQLADELREDIEYTHSRVPVSFSRLWGMIVEKSGWDAGFLLLTISCGLAALLFAVTWNVRGQEVVKH
ncbi:hypothetical protein [Mesobacillus zeae]|uniref:hypothetical protein n=1 Tax=Mesobacillus zeae TaxID=1917180 RepID=UPI0035BE9AFF